MRLEASDCDRHFVSACLVVKIKAKGLRAPFLAAFAIYLSFKDESSPCSLFR